MHANEKPLSFLRETTKYKIPFFQRSYVWTKENWEELWEELSSDRENSFLGSIILKRTRFNGVEYKLVIDGQQRLTTLSILVKSLMNYLLNTTGRSNTYNVLSELILYTDSVLTRDNYEEKTYPRIEHSRLDKAAFESVLRDSITDEQKHPIISCFKYFEERFNMATIEEINRIIQKVAYNTSNLLVVIDLEENDDEQIIFDTINSAGVKLTAADIIKNAVYQKIDSDSTDTETHYNENWKKTFEEDQETIDMWLEMKGSGQNRKTYIDIFFHCFAIMKGFFNPTKHKISDLADHYKKEIQNKTIAETKTFIEDICNNAKKYKEIFIGYDSVTAYKFDNSRNRLLHILNTTKITIFDAFVLFAVNTYTEEKCEIAFKYLETYIMRNYILGNRSIVQSYNQDLIKMLHEEFNFCEKLNQEALSNLRLQHKLNDIDNNPAKLALFWIELYLRANTPESDQNETGLTYNYQLEHIMPQSWEENWSIRDCPVYYDENKVEDVEEATKIRKKSIRKIGNMTLLTAKLNDRISNSSFNDKVEGRIIRGKFEPGIKQNSSLRITVEDVVNESEWNESKITARTKKISDLFEKVWPIPQIN
ncbi:MAG: DUF262 domain-containing HNH endonuclease family protein [Acutalibacteraceae bacterium]|nr:DUF262 domain-containing HNH endonuclease family protein [Acutalibacteraceae bacterium]